MASQHSSVSLYDGTKVPALGLGTWKIPQDVAAKVVEDAIRIGYRHIDCACDYANEVIYLSCLSRVVALYMILFSGNRRILTQVLLMLHFLLSQILALL